LTLRYRVGMFSAVERDIAPSLPPRSSLPGAQCLQAAPHPDESRMLSEETVERLRAALAIQREAGDQPVPELQAAIHAAAAEARLRNVPAEAILVQLKSLATRAGVGTSPLSESGSARSLREWMVVGLLRAYWGEPG
jgi:hypothetical protein